MVPDGILCPFGIRLEAHTMDQLNRGHTAPTKTSSDRTFGLVFAAFFALIAVWPLIQGLPLRGWAIILAAGFALIALARPAWLSPLNRQWTRLGLLLHRLVNPIVLGLIFILTIAPTGLIMRLLGKDPLRLKRDNRAASYWIERRPPGPAPESLPRQF